MSLISWPPTYPGLLMDRTIHWRNFNENNRAVRLITEVSLSLLTVVSTIQGMVYQVLAFVSVIFIPLTETPFMFFEGRALSCGVTMRCGVYNLYSNLFHSKILSVVEYENYLFPRSVAMTREIQRLQRENERLRSEKETLEKLSKSIEYRKELIRQLDSNVISYEEFQVKFEENERLFHSMIVGYNKVVQFLLQEILADTCPETKLKFDDMDPDMLMFVTTKAIFIYAYGSRREDELPDFFTPITKNAIAYQRVRAISKNSLDFLKGLCSDLPIFMQPPTENIAHSHFNDLRGIASEEMQRCVDSQILQNWNLAATLLNLIET